MSEKVKEFKSRNGKEGREATGVLQIICETCGFSLVEYPARCEGPDQIVTQETEYDRIRL